MSRQVAFRGRVVAPVLFAMSLGVAASGCRLLPTEPQTPLALPAELGAGNGEPADGARVALVRDAMIESAAMSEGPPHSEQAREAVRVWRGQGGDDAAGGG